MKWEDECFLLSKKKFRENANIINVFTYSRGRVSGVVYGGNSRKVKNYLQISNKLFIEHNSKNENKLGYFKTELVEPISPLFFNNKEKTSALISLCSILNILLPESQPNQKIYKSLEQFIKSMNLNEWIVLYIFFELNLIKELGYDPNLKQYKKKINNSEITKIKIDTFVYEVPEFLISKKNSSKFIKIFNKKIIKFYKKYNSK